MDVVIYHNPDCGTSRNTLAMIRNAERGRLVAACCTLATPQGVCCPPKPELAPDDPCCGIAPGKA